MVRTEKEILYRRATIADVPALVDCRARFLNELYNHPENEETKVIRKSLLAYFSRAISSQDIVVWVAELDGRIVGTSGMVVWEKPALYEVESGKLGYLLNFYSAQDARGKGIATRLLNELIHEAQLLGLKYLHLHASKDGEPIYRKAGFVETEMPELRLRLESALFAAGPPKIQPRFSFDSKNLLTCELEVSWRHFWNSFYVPSFF